MSTPRLWMVSGEREVGKSTFCRALAAHARQFGWDVAGLFCPAVFEGGQKTGILAEAVRTGEARLLASTHRRTPADLRLGQWYFDHGVLDWGDQVIASSPPCDLLIIDELGPLELVHQAGWWSALGILGSSPYQVGLVVVRPELQLQVYQRLPITSTLTLDKTRPTDTWVQHCWTVISAGIKPGVIS
ncbi:MAG TPA: nucleoside-triphosphatase [Anaerolineales bacterium]|nr:nucleoside-triphosphatase [Anaerolineales bacterium]